MVHGLSKIFGFSFNLISLSVLFQISYKILIPGTFHDGEVHYSEKSEIWLGLYNERDTFFLKETKVDFERVNDPILDLEDEKTGIQVTTDQSENLIILIDSSFRKMPGIPIQTSLPTPLIMYPGDTVNISLPDNPNTVLIAQNGFIWIEADDKKQQLTNVYPKGMEESLTVLWAGDLDGDTEVDFIIDDINHYNTWINYRLFLSSYADTSKIVKEVANLTGQGC